MYAEIEPTGCSVRRGAVQLRIDLFLDEKDAQYEEYQDAPFHSHFIQVSPDITDDELQKLMQKHLNGFGAEFKSGGDLVAYNHRNKCTPYQPFNVDAPVEALCFDALREGKTPALAGDSMSKHLIRSAIKGLDIAARKDSFMVSR